MQSLIYPRLTSNSLSSQGACWSFNLCLNFWFYCSFYLLSTRIIVMHYHDCFMWCDGFKHARQALTKWPIFINQLCLLFGDIFITISTSNINFGSDGMEEGSQYSFSWALLRLSYIPCFGGRNKVRQGLWFPEWPEVMFETGLKLAAILLPLPPECWTRDMYQHACPGALCSKLKNLLAICGGFVCDVHWL